MPVNHYQNKMYLKLMDGLGPVQSLILLEKLIIDLKDTMRGFKAAQSATSRNMLLEPSHVLISLAGVVGITELHQAALDINNHAASDQEPYPTELVRDAISEIDLWLMFLKADKSARDQA